MDQRCLEKFSKTRLRPGEVVLAFCPGEMSGRHGEARGGGLILTDRRLVYYSSFLFREVMEEVALSDIKGVMQRSLPGRHTIEIHTPGEPLVFRTSDPAARDSFLAHIERPTGRLAVALGFAT